MTQSPSAPAPEAVRADPAVLARNLRALGESQPELVDRLEQAEPTELDWARTKTGSLAAGVMPADGQGRPIALCSRYNPEKEAIALLDGIDFEKNAAIAVIGFGVGHHVFEVAKRISTGGAVGMMLVFEPDLGLLKAVLSRVDMSSWIGHPHVLVFTPETDRAELLSRADKFGVLLTQGTHVVQHPATRRLHPEAVAGFATQIKDLITFARTNVATALVNSARTCDNLIQNLDLYAAGGNTDVLRDAAKGCPAVCVAAGPSLVRNVHLLQDPEIRKKVVVIAVQTALRPLLDRGIRPDFVTALDYSSICTRFYEGLPELPDVTLVVEPKVHPAVVDAYPGPVRTVPNAFNNDLMGELPKPEDPLKAGATVAHLSFYLAEHLGCDPIAFIGQDLGFSDGLYYAPGTSVHRVWEPELGPFNTLEMMEWTRIVRMRGNLKRYEDVHGQPIFSDEQMTTYLKQFERDFAKSVAEGRTIIDATEGGMPKEHTVRMPLAEVIEKHATKPVPALPTGTEHYDATRLQALHRLLQQRVREMNDLKRSTREGIRLLKAMVDVVGDRSAFHALHEKLSKVQRHVEHDLGAAFKTVNHVNSIGAFRRVRADRMIRHTTSNGKERQSHQIDRDIENLDFLLQACEEAMTMFDGALVRCQASLKALPSQMKPRSKRSRAA